MSDRERWEVIQAMKFGLGDGTVIVDHGWRTMTAQDMTGYLDKFQSICPDPEAQLNYNPIESSVDFTQGTSLIMRITSVPPDHMKKQ